MIYRTISDNYVDILHVNVRFLLSDQSVASPSMSGSAASTDRKHHLIQPGNNKIQPGNDKSNNRQQQQQQQAATTATGTNRNMTTTEQMTTGKRKAATGAAGKSTRATEVTKAKKPKTVGDEDAIRKSFTREQLEYLKQLKRAKPTQKSCSTIPGKEGHKISTLKMKPRDDDKEFFGITNDGLWMIPEDAEGDGILFDEIVQWMIQNPSVLNRTDKSVRDSGVNHLGTKFSIHGTKRMEEMDLEAAKEEARAAIQASTTAAPSADIRLLTGTVGELTGAVGQLVGTVGQQQVSIGKLTGIAEKQQSSIGQLRDTASDLTSAVTIHENRLEGHEAVLQNLSSQVQESERKVQESERKLRVQEERIKALERSRPTNLNSAFAEEEDVDGDDEDGMYFFDAVSQTEDSKSNEVESTPELVEEEEAAVQERPVRRVSWAQKVEVKEYSVALLHNPGCKTHAPIVLDKPVGEAFETDLLHVELVQKPEDEDGIRTMKEKMDLLRASGMQATDIFDQVNTIDRLQEREQAQHDEWLDDGDDVVLFGSQSRAAIFAAKKYRQQKIQEWQRRQTQTQE